MGTKKVRLDVWIQLLGMLGVLGGLLFVGLEMRQSQKIALGAQQQARTELNSSRLLTELELLGEIGPAAITSSGIEWEELSADQKVIREQIQRWFWTLLENNFYQYELGLINEELWEQIKGRIGVRWSECHLRHVVPIDPLSGLRRYLDSLPDNCSE